MGAMFTFIGSLPLVWKVIIPILILIALVLIAILGGMSIQWGSKTLLRLGKGRRRSCMDCSRYVRITQTKTNQQISKIENKKLKDKMNYVEHKLLGLHNVIYRAFSKAVTDKGCSPTGVEGLRLDIKESQECNLFEARLTDVLRLMKDEIRRSFKENGFHELSTTEFNAYVKDQIEVLFTIFDQYMSANFPRQMILSLVDLKDVMSTLRSEIEDTIEEIYMRANELENDAERKILDIETDYETAIDNYINFKH